MGVFFSTEICDIPFLGEAACRPDGFIDVISEGLIRRNKNVEVTDYKVSGEKRVDLYFVALDETLTFAFDRANVLTADGSSFEQACYEYAEHCEVLGIDPITESLSSNPMNIVDFRTRQQNESRSAMERPVTGRDIQQMLDADPNFPSSSDSFVEIEIPEAFPIIYGESFETPPIERPITLPTVNSNTTSDAYIINASLFDSLFQNEFSRNTIFDFKPHSHQDYLNDSIRVKNYERALDSTNPISAPKIEMKDFQYSRNAVGNVRISKQGVDLALDARAFTKRAAYFGPQKIARSIANGSLISHNPSIPIKIWKDQDKILGTVDPARAAGTHTIHRNVPTDAEFYVSMADGEILIEADYYFYDGNTFLLTIAYPGGYATFDHCEGKSGPEAYEKLVSISNFHQCYNRKTKLIRADGECGFDSIKEPLKKIGIIMKIESRGKKTRRYRETK